MRGEKTGKSRFFLLQIFQSPGVALCDDQSNCSCRYFRDRASFFPVAQVHMSQSVANVPRGNPVSTEAAINCDSDESFLTLASRNDFRFDPRIVLPLPLFLSFFFFSPKSSRPFATPRFVIRAGGPVPPSGEVVREHVCTGAALRRREIWPAACTCHYVRAWISTIGRPTAPLVETASRFEAVELTGRLVEESWKSRVGSCCVSFSLPIAFASLSRRSVPSFVGHPIAISVHPASRTMASTMITTIAILLTVIRKFDIMQFRMFKTELSERHMIFQCIWMV